MKILLDTMLDPKKCIVMEKLSEMYTLIEN